MQIFTGIEYLMIDIANSFGQDKLTWDERLQWFKDHRKYHEFATETELKSFISKAKEPAQALAGILAYRATVYGEPTGYLCGLDATASGIQILSVLSNCYQSAQMCNLINNNQRMDVYTAVHEHICFLLNTTPAQFPISRKDSKAAVMTHMYGSKAQPRRVFGEDTPELAAFYEAIDYLLPGANQLNHDLLSLWNPETCAHTWTLPDGFDVVVKVMDHEEHNVNFMGRSFVVRERVNRPMETGLSLGANIVHSIDGMVVREMNRRCNFTQKQKDLASQVAKGNLSTPGYSTLRKKDLALLRLLALVDMSGFLSAVVLEYLDKENAGHLNQGHLSMLGHLVNSMPVKAFPLICIHDCFKFHPNYGNDVRHQYMQIMAELSSSDILTSIASELAGKHVPVNKLMPTLRNPILCSEYAIC